MTKIMKARKGGFTLVELLIVIMIIAILAGMMLLATGSATDGAEATKIINDLRNLKSAALLFYGDNLAWPTQTAVGSLDMYADRPIVGASPKRYASVIIGTPYTAWDSASGTSYERTNIGVQLEPGKNDSAGIQKKLAQRAIEVGLLTGSASNANYYTGDTVFMNMR
jgi:general secretion pathway protein G